jgi:phosphoglucomutase
MSYQDVYQYWCSNSALSPSEQAELSSIAADDKEINSRFFASLEFGTAGLRGIMGVGLARMNIHVIRHATQAFAAVILEEGQHAAAQGIAICYDCRNHSDEFAKEAACVMAGNGIPVRLFESLRPTPELSFAIREYGCIAGINVTASHNPKEYNGYKVYWSDGAQLPPHHASAIAAKMEELDVFTSIQRMDYDEAVQTNMITIIGEEIDEKFLTHVMAQVNDRAAVEAVADTFKMVYTPFHGTGYRLIP